MGKKLKYTKVELLHSLKNIADIRPHSSVKKLNKFYKAQDDIRAGKIKTPAGIRRRF